MLVEGQQHRGPEGWGARGSMLVEGQAGGQARAPAHSISSTPPPTHPPTLFLSAGPGACTLASFLKKKTPPPNPRPLRPWLLHARVLPVLRDAALHAGRVHLVPRLQQHRHALLRPCTEHRHGGQPHLGTTGERHTAVPGVVESGEAGRSLRVHSTRGVMICNITSCLLALT